MRRIIFLSIIFTTLCLACMAQGSPCSGSTTAQPFCTDENPYGITYPSGTSGSANSFLGQARAGCLTTTPCPAWYYMQIQDGGTLNFHIVQTPSGSGTGDVDFACWGPFQAASQADFMNNLCTGVYNLYLNQHESFDWGGTYPVGNLVDCCYCSDNEETCHIPNAQPGEWYLILITNFSQQPGTISFTPTTGSTATTNCNLLNSGDSNSPICEGGTLELYVTAPVNGATYNWTGPNGFAQSTTNTTLQVPNVTANMSGEYHMTMSGISQSSSEAVVEVTIYPSPQPEIIASQEAICLGDSVLLSAGGNNNYSYKWSAKPLLNGSYSIIANGTTSLTVYPEESYRYVLIAQANECTGLDSVDIIVNPHPDIEITVEKAALCYSEGTSITATGGSYYNWSNGSTTNSIYVTPEETTTYSLEVLNDALCSSEATVEIIVYPELHSTHSIIPSYCDQLTGKITMEATGGMGKYVYTCPGIIFSDNTASNLSAGTYTVTITDSVECFITQTVEIPIVPGPSPCFIFSSSDDVNMVITNCTQGNNSYFWDFGDGVTSSETHPTHEYMDPGRYTVGMVVTDEHNCIDSLRQDYVINGPVYIANAFTPNGDGVNDVLYIIGKTIQKAEYLWAIYDRHGSLVFLSYDPEIGWDGTLPNGKDAQPGVYVYRLKYKDVNGNYFERDGDITLIR